MWPTFGFQEALHINSVNNLGLCDFAIIHIRSRQHRHFRMIDSGQINEVHRAILAANTKLVPPVVTVEADTLDRRSTNFHRGDL